MPPRVITGRIEAQRLDASDGLVFRDAVVIDVDLAGQVIPVFQASGTLFERPDFSRSRITGVLGVKPWATYRDGTFERTDGAVNCLRCRNGSGRWSKQRVERPRTEP